MEGTNKTREEHLEDFHVAFGAAINAEPTAYLLRSRKTLIEEETKELFAEIDTAVSYLEKSEEVPRAVYQAMLKELADVQVVISGLSVGLKPLYQKLEKAFRLVHASHMSKMGEDGKPIVREDGKILKGPHYSPPDLSGLV